MFRIGLVLFACVCLGACKTEFRAELYVDDVKAVASGEEARIDVPATLSIVTLGGGVCSQQAAEAGRLVTRFFGTSSEPRCTEGDYGAVMTIKTSVPVIRAGSDAQVNVPEGSIVAFGLFTRDDKRTVVIAATASNGFDKIQRAARATFYEDITADDITVAITLNNDQRGPAEARVAGAFVDGIPAAKPVMATIDRRGRADVVQSDVRTAYLLDGGQLPILDFPPEE